MVLEEFPFLANKRWSHNDCSRVEDRVSTSYFVLRSTNEGKSVGVRGCGFPEPGF